MSTSGPLLAEKELTQPIKSTAENKHVPFDLARHSMISLPTLGSPVNAYVVSLENSSVPTDIVFL